MRRELQLTPEQFEEIKTAFRRMQEAEMVLVQASVMRRNASELLTVFASELAPSERGLLRIEGDKIFLLTEEPNPEESSERDGR